MLAANLDDVVEKRLAAMCGERRGETPTLEWKEQLPDPSDRQKHELAKDVAALANFDGGDLVYGIVEDDGQAVRIAPILTAETADEAERRIRQVLESLVEPRLGGIQVKSVPIAAGGYVLVVRVPASFEGPHWIRVNNNRRFVVRNGTGTSDMSYEQVRGAFDRTATLREQGAQFRAQRLTSIRSGQTPVRLEDGPLAVLHVIPLSGLARRQSLDVAALFRSARTYNLLRRVRTPARSTSTRTNLEGGVVYVHGSDEEHPAYTQVFRNGATEAVFMCGRRREMRNGQEAAGIWTTLLVDHFRNGASEALEELRMSGFTGPVIVGAAMVRVGDFGLATNDMFRPITATARSLFSDDLIVPEEWIEHLESARVDDVVRPMMDALWQAFDVSRCDYFDATSGDWLPRHG